MKFWKFSRHRGHTDMPRPPYRLYAAFFGFLHRSSIDDQIKYSFGILPRAWPCFIPLPLESLMFWRLFSRRRHPQDFTLPIDRSSAQTSLSDPQSQTQCQTALFRLSRPQNCTTVNLEWRSPVLSMNAPIVTLQIGKRLMSHGKMAFLGLSALLLSACTAGGAKLDPVALPAAPECMAPVPVPKAKAGDDARLALKKSHAALGQANGRLVCSRNWYNGVRKSYSPSQ